jgi:phospholipid N-methyltransferase
MQSRLRFLGQWVRNPREVGSVTPSSRFLTREVVEPVMAGGARLIVELGPGTGVFTRALLEALPADGRILAVDTNAAFIEHLAKQLPDRRLTAVHASAEEVDRLVADAGWPAADAIISGIPYSLLPRPVTLGIVQAAHRALREDGLFIGYQYSRMLRPYLLQVFGNVHYRSVLLNLPPAFVYASRVRAAAR